MYEYLAAHPDIFMPAFKEPHFFAEDIPARRQITSMESYESLFPHTCRQYRRQGEASVFYLFSEVALGRIKEFNPDAQIIIMLRNPVDMALSYHSQLLFTGAEDISDFATAWESQDRRSDGGAIPAGCKTPKLLQYRMVISLGSQVERALEHFSREQIEVIFFDDFVRDPHNEYEKLLTFLGVQSDGRKEFRKVNSRKVPRMRWLINLDQRLQGSIPLRAIQMWRVLRLHKLRKMMVRRRVEPSRPGEDFLRHISAEMSPEIDKLSEFAGRNLDPWKRMEWLQ